ncbi:unnamed protein product [Owenia fusiformis]|uniref:Uncharacterized protein n=1 Tax=Owenia fusiformis TaxID=6347 RepID=A0A8J1XXM5_OWEFU|nr:unnamed protein product [Owenia fusiformis]
MLKFKFSRNNKTWRKPLKSIAGKLPDKYWKTKIDNISIRQAKYEVSQDELSIDTNGDIIESNSDGKYMKTDTERGSPCSFGQSSDSGCSTAADTSTDSMENRNPNMETCNSQRNSTCSNSSHSNSISYHGNNNCSDGSGSHGVNDEDAGIDIGTNYHRNNNCHSNNNNYLGNNTLHDETDNHSDIKTCHMKLNNDNYGGCSDHSNSDSCYGDGSKTKKNVRFKGVGHQDICLDEDTARNRYTSGLPPLKPKPKPPPLMPPLMSKDENMLPGHMTSTDMLPGSMETEMHNSNSDRPIVSRTELDMQGTAQHGGERRQQITSLPSGSVFDRIRGKAFKSMNFPEKPVATTQAWSNQTAQKNKTVEERLKTLLTSSGLESDAETPPANQQKQDGELLIAPPPRSRQLESPTHHVARPIESPTHNHDSGVVNNGYHHDDVDNNDNVFFDDLGFTSPQNVTLNESVEISYVPSHPDERIEGARGEVMLQRKYSGNDPLPEDISSPQKNDTEKTASNIRDLCSRLYGTNVSSVRKPGFTTSASKLNSPYQDSTQRSSPQGQSSSPLSNNSSTQGHTSMERPPSYQPPPPPPKPHYVTSPETPKGNPPYLKPPPYPSPRDHPLEEPKPKLPPRNKTTAPASPVRTHRPMGNQQWNQNLSNQNTENGFTKIHNMPGNQNKPHVQFKTDNNAPNRTPVASRMMPYVKQSTPQDHNQLLGNDQLYSQDFSSSSLNIFNMTGKSQDVYPDYGIHHGDIVDINDVTADVSSLRSVTPPLPPLSPNMTPPLTPEDSPRGLPKFHNRSVSAINLKNALSNNALSTAAPDVVTSASKLKKKKPTQTGMRRSLSGHPNMKYEDRKYRKSKSRSKTPNLRVSSSRLQQLSMSELLERTEDETTDFDNDTVSDFPGTNTDLESTLGGEEADIIRQQLDGLELMYHEILKMLGVNKDSMPEHLKKLYGKRLHKSRRSHSARRQAKELKNINKRFARLESHVVTLARSVAHLSSEMRSQNTVYQDIDLLKTELLTMKERQHSMVGTGGNGALDDWDRFRGWVPAMTNPKRISKLTKFFGKEPPLLNIFLEKLGYNKWIPNFENEHIGMVELPYMTEERLQKIGIPMGPRLRILQEAQMCFRQENFNIYIV